MITLTTCCCIILVSWQIKLLFTEFIYILESRSKYLVLAVSVVGQVGFSRLVVFLRTIKRGPARHLTEVAVCDDVVLHTFGNNKKSSTINSVTQQSCIIFIFPPLGSSRNTTVQQQNCSTNTCGLPYASTAFEPSGIGK